MAFSNHETSYKVDDLDPFDSPIEVTFLHILLLSIDSTLNQIKSNLHIFSPLLKFHQPCIARKIKKFM
jgi:hypothetical protein